MRKIFILFFGLIIATLILDTIHEFSAITWQHRVEEDLKVIYKNIEFIHPGLSEIEVASWHEKGYLLAKKKLGEIDNIEDASAVVKYYINGFKDIHVNSGHYKYCIGCFVSNKFSFRFWQIGPENPSWAGYQLDNTYTVKYVSPSWDKKLPAVGDKLASCDGLSVKTIWESRILPYVNHNTHSVNSTQKVINLFSMRFPSIFPLLNSQKWKTCVFTSESDKKSTSYDIKWASFDAENSKGFLINENMNSRVVNVQSNGIIYIAIPSFSFNEKEKQIFQDRFLKRLQSIEEREATVIDLRFNTGGSSTRVFEIIESLVPNHLRSSTTVEQISYNRFRITDELIDVLDKRLRKIAISQEQISYDQVMLERLVNVSKKALAENLSSIVFPVVSTETFYSNFNNVRTKKFAKKIYILTDGRCASACVVFLKIMKELDNVIHIGEHPHMRTIYTDQISVRTKNNMKVNIPYRALTLLEASQPENLEPDIKYEGNFADQEQLKTWFKHVIQEP